jgi:UDP-N-acetylglucosamine 3-dehydrogenase
MKEVALPAQLTVVVIGSGTMGSVHAEAYARLPQAHLVGIVDPFSWNPDLARHLNVPVYGSLDDIPSGAYDAVDVAVPTPWHPEWVLEAASRGKAILCEKPVARTLEAARALIDETARAGSRLTVGHCVRFFPEYEAAERLVKAGDLGEIAVVRTFRGGGFPRGWQDWYANRAWSGGTLVDLVIHDFDFLRATLGPVSRVFAKTTQGELNRLELSLATLRFQSGAMAHVEGSWAHQGFSTRFEIVGQAGILTHDSAEAGPVRLRASGTPSRNGVALPDLSAGASPYVREIAHFVDAVLHDQPFRVTPEDAYEALAIAIAAERSAATGDPVTMEGASQ